MFQAITRLPFPVSDTNFTRFATEVALLGGSSLDSIAVLIEIADPGDIEGLSDIPDLSGVLFDFAELAEEFSE